jgi:UDP-2,3-diacylglucosamine pyrophosphatase LpxH
MKIKVISDIHLGINESNDFNINKETFLAFLINLSQTHDYVILLGDVYDCWESDFDSQVNRFNDIKDYYIDITNFIIETDNVILISGNHDSVIYNNSLISKIITHKVICNGNFKLYFAHGHQGDVYNSELSFIGSTISRLVGISEKLINPNIDKELDKLLQTFQPYSHLRIMEHGLMVGNKYGAHLVVYGHTHVPQLELGSYNYRPIIYANSGCVSGKIDNIDVVDIDCGVELVVNLMTYSFSDDTYTTVQTTSINAY